MDCAALPNLLPLIMTGRLSAAAASRLEDHIARCELCRERVGRARTARRADTARIAATEIPPTLAASREGGTIKYGSDTGRIDDDPAPGSVIGGYVILDEIARGGMGIVYRANQTHMNRVVALKVLPRRAAEDEELVARFIREARAVAELNHPNVVRIYDIGRDEHAIFYSMEFVPGRTLKALIEDHGRLPPKKAVDIAIACARALEAAEAVDIVHRDVKPDNLLIGADGSVKLADLGLVRHERTGKEAAELTRAGDLLGTPSYMAPEHARDSRLADKRSDLWSLGATLYHALFGVPPFVGKTALDTISLVLRDEVHYPPEAETLAPSLRAALKGLLTRAPGDRFQTASEALRALERARTDSETRRASARSLTGSSSERRARTGSGLVRTSSAELAAARGAHFRRRVRRSRPWLSAGAATAFLGVSLGLISWLLSQAPNEPPRAGAPDVATLESSAAAPAEIAPTHSALVARDVGAVLELLRHKPGRAREARASVRDRRDRLGTELTAELDAAIDAVEKLIESADRGLAAAGPELLALRDGRKVAGPFALENGEASGEAGSFRFPDDLTLDALETLARRDPASSDPSERAAALALLGEPAGAGLRPTRFARLLALASVPDR